MSSYNEIVRECFFYPKHAGGDFEITPLTVVVEKISGMHQSKLQLLLSVNQEKQITDVRFRAVASPYVIAGLEWGCCALLGTTLNKVDCITHQELVKILGIPKLQYSEAILVESAFKEGLTLLKNMVKG